MYDGQNDTWMVRQTGFMVAVPELWGNFFIGRAKEGFSLTKVMSGYDPWAMERFTFNETIPLLADGIKWLGYLPKQATCSGTSACSPTGCPRAKASPATIISSPPASAGCRCSTPSAPCSTSR